MAVYESSPRQKLVRSEVALGRLEGWNRMNRIFTGIAGTYTENQADTSGPLPEKLVCAKTSPRSFPVLGAPPLLGRGFSPDEEVTNGPPAAVISERLWSRRFNRDPQALGKMLRFGDQGYPIVGVVPDSFRFPADDVDVWLRANLPPQVMRAGEARYYHTVGRIQEGVKPRAAQADLTASREKA